MVTNSGHPLSRPEFLGVQHFLPLDFYDLPGGPATVAEILEEILDTHIPGFHGCPDFLSFGQSVGEATQRAQHRFVRDRADRYLLDIYNLIGDPATVVKVLAATISAASSAPSR